MKKWYYVLLGFSLLWGCNVQAGFRVSGFYEGNNVNTMVYLFALEGGNVSDTLASLSVLNRRFVLTGELSRPVDARLLLVDEHRGIRIDSVDFDLRNASYLAYVGNVAEDLVMESREEEALAAAFYSNEKNFVDRKRNLAQQFVVATDEQKDSLSQIFESLIVAYEKEEMRLVEENPDSRAAACAVSSSVPMYAYMYKRFIYSLGTKVNGVQHELDGWDHLMDCHALLSDNQKLWLEKGGSWQRWKPVERRMEQIRLELATSVGKTAPDMVLTDRHGKECRLYDVQAKLKIVDFWASWCGPCRKKNPFMLKLYEEFQDKGLEVVSVSLDEREADWLKAVREDKLTWPYNVRDRKNQAARLYGITAIPCVLLLDEQNKIIGRNLPEADLLHVVESTLK